MQPTFPPKVCSGSFFASNIQRKEGETSIQGSPGRHTPSEGAADFAGAHWNSCFSQTTSSRLIKYKLTTLCWHSANYPHRGKSDPCNALKWRCEKDRANLLKQHNHPSEQPFAGKKKFHFNKHLCSAKSRVSIPFARKHCLSCGYSDRGALLPPPHPPFFFF